MANVIPPSTALAVVTKMSEKCKSTIPSAIQVKNHPETISTEEKLDIIRQLAKGEWIVDICHDVGFAHGSIRTIRDNTDKITEIAKYGTKVCVQQD